MRTEWRSGLTAATLAAAVIVAGLGAPTAAQTTGRTTGPAGIASLAAGAGVYITDLAGERRKGTVQEASGAGVSFTNGRESWTLASTDIQKIELQDPLRNGAAYGMATVAGLVAVGCAAAGSRPGECTYTLIYSLPAIAIGAGIGALVDSRQHEAVYDRRTHAAVVPLVSRDRVGAQLAVRW